MLRDERRWRRRKGLRRPSLLAFGFTPVNRALFDRKNRPPRFSFQHEEVAGLVAGYDNRSLCSIAAQVGEDRLGGGVVIPQIVVDELKPPDQLTGLCRQRHDRIRPSVVARPFSAVIIGTGA